MARTATVTRNTRETQITLTIDLDGTGRADLHTGIGFFDHMLDGFARHGLFDVSVTCRGDLDVDCHHTIEDIGIALGTGIKEALGDKAGWCGTAAACCRWTRRWHSAPSIWAGGPTLCTTPALQAELRRHGHPDGAGVFLRRIVQRHDEPASEGALRENDHHKLEAMFKAFAKRWTPRRAEMRGSTAFCPPRGRCKGDARRGNDGRL